MYLCLHDKPNLAESIIKIRTTEKDSNTIV